MARHAGVTEPGTGEFVLLNKRVVRAIAAESRELADEIAILRAELQLVREERDDLLRRAQAAEAIWKPVRKRKRRRPTSEGS